jgi:hypothetical protein
MLSQLAGHVARRALSSSPPAIEYDVPAWTGLLVLLDVLLFLPVWIFVGYTVGNVFPALAMVEDENPPAYEPLATAAEAVAAPADDGDLSSANANATKTDGSPRAVTSSLRLTTRMVRSQTGGPRAFLRGLPVYLFTSVSFGLLQEVISAFLPRPLGLLAAVPASLALVQFSTAWVHTIMTPRSPLPFWRRLPPFRRTFDATCRPTLLVYAAHAVGTLAPALAASLLDIRVPAPGERPSPDMAWKGLVLAVSVLVQVFVTIPAEVVLTRIQASLLPPDQETIVPFDRTFGGAVEPELVTGRGYASIADAWGTFSRSAWRRLVVLYAKIAAVGVAAWLLMVVVLIPEVLLVVANSTERKQ